jgi:hypothetical protein
MVLMYKPISYPSTVDLNAFGKEHLNPPSFYRLPKNVKFCKNCVISNQRPNSAVEYNHTSNSLKEIIHYNEMGICDACILLSAKRTKLIK